MENKPIADYLPIADVVLEAPIFLFWNALLIEANRESKAADWLLDNAGVPAYWPNFPRKVRRKGTSHGHRACSVIPGLLFVPTEFMDIARRDEIMRYLHSYGFLRASAGPQLISKRQVEIIREIEAKLNLPDDSVGDAVGNKLEVGQRVRFLNKLYASLFGDSQVVEVVSKTRIGVEVAQLFGSKRVLYTPADEIEVM